MNENITTDLGAIKRNTMDNSVSMNWRAGGWAMRKLSFS